jgi:hypothetical protein
MTKLTIEIDPETQVVMSRKPTFEMLHNALPGEALKQVSGTRGRLIRLYKAMLCAAPPLTCSARESQGLKS